VAGPPVLSRTGWLAVVAAFALVVGLAVRWAWPSTEPALDCAVADVRFDGAMAYCAPGAPGGGAPVGPALTVGVKLDLNRASAEEITVLPGVGPSLAQAIVQERARRGGAFRGWDEVDAIPGVGPAKLAVLQGSAEIR